MAAREEDGRRAWLRLEELYTWTMLDAWYRGLPDGVPRDSVVDSLRDVRLVRQLVSDMEYGLVKTARLKGMTWTEIGMALGMTRDRAWERWHQDEKIWLAVHLAEQPADDQVDQFGEGGGAGRDG